MVTTRTLKAYGIALALIWLYTVAGIFFACIVYPSTLTTSDNDRPPHTLNIRFADPVASPSAP